MKALRMGARGVRSMTIKKTKKTSKSRVGTHALAAVRKFFPNVTHVEDASESIDVTVTVADDKASKRMEHDTCAMAVACKREQKVDGVIISRKTAYLIKGKTATRYELPESVSREVVSFDRGAGFAPGDYSMRPPSGSRKLGALSGGVGGDRHRGTGKPVRRVHKTDGIRAVLGSKAL
jgi:hypothetical protein